MNLPAVSYSQARARRRSLAKLRTGPRSCTTLHSRSRRAFTADDLALSCSNTTVSVGWLSLASKGVNSQREII